MVTETLGARLRKQRESRTISLRAIADQTKIKYSLLEGLERDDVSQWPSGLYRRAYLRTYATAIGLEPEAILREFLATHPDPDEPADITAAIAEVAGSKSAPPTRLRGMVESAFESFARFRGNRLPAAEADDAPRTIAAVEDAPAVSIAGATAIRPQPESSPKPSSLPSRTIDALRSMESQTRTAAPATTTPAPALTMSAPAAQAPAAQAPAAQAPAAQPPAPSAAEAAPKQPAAAAPRPVTTSPDLLAVAKVCTALGQVDDISQVQQVLRDAAKIIKARGLIVWIWDALSEELRPTLAHGYSQKMLARLPGVRRDADNVTAAAFRASQAFALDGGALAIPMLTPAGCAGVLALEVPQGSEQTEPVRAVATIIAAMLAQLIGCASASAIDTPERPTVLDSPAIQQ